MYDFCFFKKIVVRQEIGRANDIKEIIEEELQSTLFDFSDFEWAKEYIFDVVVR
ncbi:MAG TPA: hypothetical protein PK367_02115 [Candidatus Paceibacterota bacterium]|nr:MAG: hypothetical protein BWX82_00311 [Parcubacteria group bacterium ADurb.Bin115]HNU81234.1 hypothetical protein [bacterium]HPW34535.1 hypothetical protein [Candidatus Paceibacterota bacterium]